MKFQELKNNIFYCGLNDAEREVFDELIPLEHGTSYNSYLIKGSEKVAIVDTMYPPKTEEYLKNLDANGVDKVDYIIANHGEQDHSGSIPALLKKYPEAVVVTNAKVKDNIKEMLLVDESRVQVINNNDELSLGDKTLKFIIAPGVHWPDTMFTYVVEDNAIFTCDFLGAHYTFEDAFAVESKELEHSAKRYYAEIMMPFRTMCKKYTQLIKDMKPELIMPSHGPVYKNTDFILDLYADWSADEGKNLAVLPYVSMYGSTEEMIDYIIKGLNAKGIDTVKFDIVRGDLGDLAMALVDATTIVLGCSMVLAGPHPAAFNIAYLAGALRPKAKIAAMVGSYGWGGNLFGKLSEQLSALKLDLIEPFMVKGKAKEEDYKKLDEIVEQIYAKHKELNLV
ncbi:MAG: FprA family A-type flavoprotein [Candidatus Gastranaerophilaceae bacterium]|nr:FprA family A-type flavoprotein [Candidatus Gastranaerophilaceae bacterium]